MNLAMFCLAIGAAMHRHEKSKLSISTQAPHLDMNPHHHRMEGARDEDAQYHKDVT